MDLMYIRVAQVLVYIKSVKLTDLEINVSRQYFMSEYFQKPRCMNEPRSYVICVLHSRVPL